MAKRYDVYSNDGGNDIPAEDGTFYTSKMSADFESGTFAIAFYDSNGDIATPTAGTVTHEMSPIDQQWHEAGTGSLSFDASSSGPVASYEMPSYIGPAVKGRVTFQGILPADLVAKAYFWRAG